MSCPSDMAYFYVSSSDLFQLFVSLSFIGFSSATVYNIANSSISNTRSELAGIFFAGDCAP